MSYKRFKIEEVKTCPTQKILVKIIFIVNKQQKQLTHVEKIQYRMNAGLSFLQNAYL